MSAPRRIDLHMHTSVSDGTDSPEEILGKVRSLDLDMFSVTDHDAVKACAVIRGLLRDGDPVFVPGAEFSCRDEEGKYHILGYGFDPEDPAVLELVALGHSLRMKKVTARLEYLRDEFGFTFPDGETEALLALDNPGKPHIGNLMVKYGYAASKEEAITKYINGIRFKKEYVRPEEAIRGILDAGGIPVLAHPFYGDGDDLILGDEMDKRILRLMDFGLLGVEAFYSGFTAKLRCEMIATAERHGLLITAGSDYHGANKMVRLGDTGLDEEDEYPDGLRRFLELFER